MLECTHKARARLKRRQTHVCCRLDVFLCGVLVQVISHGRLVEVEQQVVYIHHYNLKLTPERYKTTGPEDLSSV